LGVLRRNPESRWNRQAEDIRELAGVQQAILGQVAPLLRPGGHLLYSVCTFTAAETDDVVKAFLAAHPGFVLEDFRTLLPAEWLDLTTDSGCVRTLPHRHDGMDAFFAVRVIKS
jgi:16S rRNA (cytosine967-C5)-methyltransferase